MLTVKFKRPGGVVEIVEAKSVDYTPAAVSQSGRATITAHGDSAGDVTIEDGGATILNAHGITIAEF